MIIEFKFPDVAEGIIEGDLVRWMVKTGEKIKEDQILVEIETDKAVVEIPSPRDGFVIKLHYKEGDEVKVGAVLVTIGDEEDMGEEEDIKEEKRRKETGTVVGVLEEPEEKKANQMVLATPGVRRIAKTMGIDIALVESSGPHGRITEEDLKRHGDSLSGIKQDGDNYGETTRVPLKGVRKTIARNMPIYQQTAAIVTHIDEADITELSLIQEKEKKLLEEKEIKLTFLPFILKAVIIALKDHPFINSTLDEKKSEIILKKYYNIGIGVDTKDGLIVPVIKDADKKSILQVAKEIKILAENARARTINIDDLNGGSFSITNIGAYGGIFATPIINYPEAAILATGRIQEKPVVINSAIKIRKILPLSLSFDHRIIDGGMAARFINSIIKHIEDPGLLLLKLR